jgi:HD-GYP domain-containing protein (c-di-GMP phosphodiesterase class II)
VASLLTTGFRELAGRGDMSRPQLMVVFQQHEKLNGTGYPTGITDTEIHPWAKLCAVADVFDAMTCHRPYRKAVGAKAACDHLKQRSCAWFDPAAVQCWTSLVEIVP